MFSGLKAVMAFAALGLAASSAMAQGYRDAGAKVNGNFGTGFYSGGRNSMGYTQGRSAFYGTPQVVRSTSPAMVMPMAPQVAQAPTTVRSYSVEPGQAMAAPQVSRSYSYEPSTSMYHAPVHRNRSSTPTYLLPKTDARKFGGHH